jgi:hypothetical protein
VIILVVFYIVYLPWTGVGIVRDNVMKLYCQVKKYHASKNK